MRLNTSTLLPIALLAFSSIGHARQQQFSKKDFEGMLKSRYDQKVVVPVVDGIIAGEYKKAELGIGPAQGGLVWLHYHLSVPLPKRAGSGFGRALNELNQLDGRTYGDLRSGINVSKLQRGEQLKVNKFYTRNGYIELEMETTGLGHLADIDANKASSKSTTTITGNSVNRNTVLPGFGLIFRFYFDDKAVLDTGSYDTVVAEMNKYLLPQEEAKKVLADEKNIDIDIGMSEDEILQKLGQPTRTVRVGNQKSLVYADMTITVTDGKVSDVKLK